MKAVIRLTQRFRKPLEPSTYVCPRCGKDIEQLTPEDETRVNEHRLLHLANEWGDSLDGSAGWIMDEDGGLRPVAE
jgi:hypothetical protein